MLVKATYIVDTTNQWVGRIASWLLLPLCLLVTMEVILRYIFNSPTSWSWEVSKQMLAAIAALGAGYTLLRHGHIGVDVLAARLSQKKKAILELITMPLFLVSITIVLWKTGAVALWSLGIQETTAGIFNPPFYYIRFVITVGVFFLLLQGVAEFIRNILLLMGKVNEVK